MRSLFTLVVAMALSCSAAISQSTPSINELLDRLNENHMGAVTDVFTQEEIQTLRAYFDEHSTDPFVESILGVSRHSTIENITGAVAVIDAEDLSQIETLGVSDILEFEGAGVVAANGQEAIIIDNTNVVYIRELRQNLATLIGTVTPPGSGQSYTGLEMSSDDELYGISTNGTGITQFSHIDQMTLGVMPIGGPTGQVVGIALGRDDGNNFYSYDIDTDLMIRINRNTGATTTLGSIGFNANFGQGMTYDGLASKLYMTAFNGTTFDSEFREVNTNTGATINLGTIVPGTTMQFGWSSFYDETLSVEGFKLVSLQLYPNPVQDELRIASDTPLQNIRVFNILGDLVLQLPLAYNRAIINMSQLKSGMYIVQITTSEDILSRKIVKL